MSKSSKNGKIGRPIRSKPHEKLTLDVSIESKKRARKLADDDDTSIGRLFEILIDRRWKQKVIA